MPASASSRRASPAPAHAVSGTSSLDPSLQRLADRIESVLARVDALLPQTVEPDWNAVAFRWRRRTTGLGVQSWLQPVQHRSTIKLSDLRNIDDAKQLIERNTRQFVEGRFERQKDYPGQSRRLRRRLCQPSGRETKIL